MAHTLSDPPVFPLVRSHNNDQIVAYNIVGVEKIYDEAQQAQTACQYDELIFVPCFCEEILLIFL